MAICQGSGNKLDGGTVPYKEDGLQEAISPPVGTAPIEGPRAAPRSFGSRPAAGDQAHMVQQGWPQRLGRGPSSRCLARAAAREGLVGRAGDMEAAGVIR